MSMFSKQKSFLGVDLGADGVKLVELREEKNRPVLFTYGIASSTQNVHDLLSLKHATPEDVNIEKKKNLELNKKPMPIINFSNDLVDRYADMLKEVCSAAKTVSKTAVVSLPVSSIFHTIVTMPTTSKSQFLEVLKIEVKKLLPYNLEDMVLDYQILDGFSTEKVKKIMVSAVPRSIVDFYGQVFNKAGLILESLESESTALERSLIGRDTSVTMLVDIGAERSNLFIIDQAVPITSHTIESGGNKINKILQNVLNIDDHYIGQIKHDLNKYTSLSNNSNLNKDKFIDLMMPVINPIAKQIEYSFDLYLSQSGNENKRPEKIVLTGGAAMIPYLSEYLSETFKIKCFLGDPWGRVVYQEKLRPLLKEIGPRLSVSIGLALKNLL